VIKVNVIGRLVDSDPLDGLTFDGISIDILDRQVVLIDPHRTPESGELGRTFLNMLVTVPTRVRAGNIGVTRVLGEGVAITTVHSKLVHMKIMIVGNRLRWLITNTLGLWTSIVSDARHYTRTNSA